MKKKTVTFFYILCVYLITFRVISAARCGPDSIDVEDRIKRGLALVGAVFWKGKIEDLTQCATACIRRKVCRSFNFDTFAGWCELNVAIEGERQFRRGTNGLMYSTIADWLSEFDPSCASRPCTANQVCIPGQLGINGSSEGQCSYICIDSTLLCPKPYAGFSGDRKVGAVVTSTCGRGEVGGDSAECLVTREWNKTLNRQCALLYGSTCDVDVDCQDIDGVCTDGTCQCPSGLIYEATTKRCVFACTSSPSYGNAVMGSETGTQRTFTCEAKYRPTVSRIECVVDSTEQTGNWSPGSGICTALYGFTCTVDDDCQDIDGVCTSSTCQCPSGMVYDTTQQRCNLACTSSPSYDNAVIGSETGARRTFTCEAKYRPTVARIECVVDSTTQTGSWSPGSGICTALYGFTCTVDDDCQDIDGVCTSSTCQCQPGMVYDTTQQRCNLACTSPPSYNNVVMGDETGAQRSFTCDAKYRPTVQRVNCVVDPGTDSGSWSPDSGICTDLYGYQCSADGDCSEIEGICDNNVCACARNKYYNNVTKECKPRFKLEPGIGGDGYKTGQLLMHNGVEWGNVCHSDWESTATRAICQDINPSFKFGGAFHGEEVYGRGNESTPSIKLKIDCGSDGSVTSYVGCTDTMENGCGHDKDMGLTCYESNITNNIRLTSVNGTGDDGQLRLEVMYDGVWGTVCKDQWNDDAANVACRSIDRALPSKKKECKDSCAGGDGPYLINNLQCDKNKDHHLFFCRNGGWTKTHICPGEEVGLICEA